MSNLVSILGKKLINLMKITSVEDTDYILVQKNTNGDQTTNLILQSDYKDLVSDTKKLGWELFFDTQYPTEGAALSSDADTWTVIPNNAGFVLPAATNLPEGVTTFYNGVTQFFTPDVAESQYLVTLGFAIKPSTANATVIIRGLLGGGSPFYGPTTIPLAVDAGESNVINANLQFPITANTLSQGIQVSFNCSADCEVWGALYQVAKIVDKSEL